ncbi:MAG: hypothetical protein ACRD15_11055 [Vicinamibacterales bacterium]
MFLRVAGLTIQIATADSGLPLALGEAASRFAIDPATPDVRVDVSAEHLAGEVGRDLVFDSGGPWRLYRETTGFLFQFFSTALGSAPYKIARANPDFTRVQVVINRSFFPPGTSIEPLEYPLDELLVINLLGQGRGLEIHACGLIDASGDGYLFVGQSGAGKSTMARLWLGERGTVILSDDRVVLRTERDGLWMYGTPWHGDEPLASPHRVRLARVFLLGQHSTHRLVPVSRGTAVARIFAASFPPFYSAPALDFSLEFIATTIASGPCHELGFTPSRSIVEFVRCSEPLH